MNEDLDIKRPISAQPSKMIYETNNKKKNLDNDHFLNTFKTENSENIFHNRRNSDFKTIISSEDKYLKNSIFKSSTMNNSKMDNYMKRYKEEKNIFKMRNRNKNTIKNLKSTKKPKKRPSTALKSTNESKSQDLHITKESRETILEKKERLQLPQKTHRKDNL